MRDAWLHADYWIGQNKDIGTAACSLDRIWRIRHAAIEVSSRCRRQMAPRGKATHANALGVDAPFGRPRADGPNRPLYVLHGCRLMIARRQAILQHERLHAKFVEPLGD